MAYSGKVKGVAEATPFWFISAIGPKKSVRGKLTASLGDAVDLVAVVLGEVDELNAKSQLESVIAHHATR